MKTQTTSFILFGVLSAMLLLGMPSGNLTAQQYLSQEGRMLDANPGLDTFGYNSPTRLDTVMPRANLYITGNVRGGQSFQGLVPYGNMNEFNGTLGSSTLSNFYRDSTGSEDLGRGYSAGLPYLDPSRQVTRSYGSQVMSSYQYFKQTGVTPVGGSLLMPEYENPLLSRPLSRMNTSLPSTGASAPSYYDSSVPSGEVPSGIAGQGMPGLGEPYRSDMLAPPNPMQVVDPTQPDLLRQPGQPMFPAKPRQDIQPQQEGVEEPKIDEGPGYYMRLERQWQNQNQGQMLTPETTEAGTQNPHGRMPMDSQSTPETPANPQPDALTSDMFSNRDGSGVSFVGNENADQLRARQLKRYLRKGESYLHQGKFYLAANAFEDASFYDPGNPVIYLAKSNALFGAGEYMSSAFYLDKSLRLKPDLTADSLNLKQLFPDENAFKARYDELTQFYNQSLQPMLLFLKGYVEFQSGDLDPSHQTMEEVAKLLPDQPSVQYLAGVIAQAKTPPDASAPAKP